jgi:hypothetical protein
MIWHRNGVAFDFCGPSGVVAEVIDCKRQVGDARDLEGLAVVERFELRKFLGVLFEQVGEFPEEFAALGRRNSGPLAGVKSCACSFDGSIDVFFVACGDVGEDLAGRGIVGRESLARGRFNPFSIDQELACLGYEAGDVAIRLYDCSSCHVIFLR